MPRPCLVRGRIAAWRRAAYLRPPAFGRGGAPVPAARQDGARRIRHDPDRRADELVAWIAPGEKPRDAVARSAPSTRRSRSTARSHAPVPYAGERGHPGPARRACRRDRLGGRSTTASTVIGLSDAARRRRDLARAGRPVRALRRAARDRPRHRAASSARISTRRSASAEPLGIGFLALGMSPIWTPGRDPGDAEEPLPHHGATTCRRSARCGLDMMFRTATVQANLDFASEADMVKKLRVALALQPVATALFANSPFTDGKPNGFLSMRSRDLARHRSATAPACCLRLRGRLRLRALCRLGARRADVLRQARRRPITTSRAPRSAISWPAGWPRCRASARRCPTGRTTSRPLFPEVRLKRYLEMRGADVGPPAHDRGPARVLDRACSTTRRRSTRPGTSCKGWTRGGPRAAARRRAAPGADGRGRGPAGARRRPRRRWRSPAPGLAQPRRPRRDGPDETGYLDPLEEIAASRPHPGRAPARRSTTAPGTARSHRVRGVRALSGGPGRTPRGWVWPDRA